MIVSYPILVALGFNLLDVISGFISALKSKSLSSSKLRDGLFKKLGFILCYGLAYIVDTYGSLVGFSLSVSVLPVVILYVCGTELVSIIENITIINPDIVPEKLKEMFGITE